jgi:hypothetical protein
MKQLIFICAIQLCAATQEDTLAQRVIQTNHAVVTEQRAIVVGTFKQ